MRIAALVPIVLGFALAGGILLDYYNVPPPIVPEYLFPWGFVVLIILVALTTASFIWKFVPKD